MRVQFFVGNDSLTEDGHFHNMADFADQPWFEHVQSELALRSRYWEPAHAPRDYPYSKGEGPAVFSLFLISPLLRDTVMELEISAADLLGSESGFACLSLDELRALTGDLPVGQAVPAQALEGAASELLETQLGGERVLLRSVALPELNVLLLHWSSRQAATQESDAALLTFYGIVAVLTGLLFALTWILSGRMSKRVRRITSAVESMYHNRYDINLPVDSTDELGALAWHMNALAERIDNLLNKALLAEMAAKDSELKALQSQINPHFIYNTLETFCMMAELGDNERLSSGIAEMGELMRYNLSGKRESTLRGEIANVHHYSSLQNLVNNDRIDLVVSSDPALDDLPIPKLLLQPLVENAILHGMEAKSRLRIELDVFKSEDDVCVRVRNNGKPIEPERLRHVRAMLSRNTVDPLATFDDCLALINISRRLKLLYGARAGVNVFSSPAGTEVLLLIPCGKEDAHAGASG